MTSSRAYIRLTTIALLHLTLFGEATRAQVNQQSASAAMWRGGLARTGTYAGGGSSLVGLAWRAPTHGDVISSPTVIDGVVYVGSNDGGVYAFDLATGAQRWRADAGSAVASAPAVGGGRVFVSVRDGSILAFDASTGARYWRLRTGALMRFPWGHESGDYYLSSPAYVNGRVIVGAGDGAVYSIDASSGTVKWKAQTAGRVRASPAIADGRVFVGAFDGRIYAIDLASGRILWRYETEGASLQSGRYGFDRRSLQSSPTVASGVVYEGARDGFIYALDAATGTLRWRYDHKVSWIITSPAVADGVVYAGSSDAAFVQAVDSSGKELWRAKTGGIVWSSPAVAGGMLYVGDGVGRIHAFDRLTGTERWSFRSGASMYSSPTIAGEYVVVGSSDGSVYALRANDGPPVQRAVFFDSTALDKARAGDAPLAARYLVNRGYRTLDLAALPVFLTERIADRAPSVVVFAIDYAPPSIVASSLLRRYLESGGKVVWRGVPPGMFPSAMPAGEIRLNWDSTRALTGVPHDSALFDFHGVRATPAGLRWGLQPRWRDAWSVDPAGVTTVLGLDDTGLAAAWVKSFGGAPGTGFVRVPFDDPLALYLAAEMRPSR